MKQGKKLQTRFLCQAILAGLALAAWTGVTFAQQAGGAGGAGGGGEGAGMATAATTLALGSGTAGTTGTTGTAKGGTGASPIQKTNFMAPYYSSAWNAGWGANITLKSQAGLNFSAEGATSSALVTGRGTFGVANVTPATATAGGAKGGAAGGAKGGAAGATTAMAATTSGGFNTVGKPRITAAFVTRLDPAMLRPTQAIAPVASVTQMQSKVGNVIALSPSLQTNGRINVAIDAGNIVVLQGTVESERDKRHAEALILTEPGVHFVRNELVITGAKK